MIFILKGATFPSTIGTVEGGVDQYIGQVGSGGATYYTITYKYINESGATIKTDTTAQKAEGTVLTFAASGAPYISGYEAKSVSPTSLTVTGDATVTYTYKVSENTGGGGETTDPTPDSTGTYNDVSYWVRQSISSTGVIETPESASYTRSNIMAINKFTKAITLKGTSEGMYFAKVTYDANGNFLARSSWDTPAVGVTVTYSDTNPFNVVIATKAETNYDLAKMISIIDVRDA